MREQAFTHGAGLFFAALAATGADRHRQPPAFCAIREFAPVGAHGVKALAQRRTRGHGAQTQRLVGKALRAKAFNRLEVVLAQGEQGQVALEEGRQGFM